MAVNHHLFLYSKEYIDNKKYIVIRNIRKGTSCIYELSTAQELNLKQDPRPRQGAIKESTDQDTRKDTEQDARKDTDQTEDFTARKETADKQYRVRHGGEPRSTERE